MELPVPAPGLSLAQLRGAWYVLASNRGEWRFRSHPRVDIELEVDGGRLTLEARFRELDMIGRERQRVRTTTAEPIAGASLGRFELRRFMGISRVRLCVAAIDPDQRWAAVWFTRSVGSAAGLDILSRDPWISQARLDSILAAIAEHPFLGSRRTGLYAPIHLWIPPEPYRFF